MKRPEPVRVGIVGTGFIVREVLDVMLRTPGLAVTRILTRRDTGTVTGLPRDVLTNSCDELLAESDIIVDATGDPIHSTVVVEAALLAGLQVVTMNSELHVTTGSYLAGLGHLTEAEGDQPGALAQLRREALAMGFTPLAYVNIKGFLNPDPTREEMEYWSGRQGLSLRETVSFTDGTKLQIEQALCANGLGAGLARAGMIGGEVDDIFDSDHLVEAARDTGGPISDYVRCGTAPPGVFVLAEHDAWERLPHYGPYEKLRTTGGLAYLLLRPFHLCGLEVTKTVLASAGGAPPLLNNGPVPRVSVAAVAKRDLEPGTTVEESIGSFDVRGRAVEASEMLDHVPLGLLSGARLRRSVAGGEALSFADVDLPESRALEIWLTELRPRIARAHERAIGQAPDGGSLVATEATRRQDSGG